MIIYFFCVELLRFRCQISTTSEKLWIGRVSVGGLSWTNFMNKISQPRQVPYNLHRSDSVWNIFFVNYLSWGIFYRRGVGEYPKAAFWFVFQMLCEQIKLSLHHYLSVKNISGFSSLDVFTSSCIPHLPFRRTLPHFCIHPFTLQHRWLILDGSIFPPCSLSVMISQGWRYRSGCTPTSLHTHTHTHTHWLLFPCREHFTVSKLWTMAPS